MQLYAGDTEGSVYIFEAKEDWRETLDCELDISYKIGKAHRNSIIQVLLVTQENLIFTISNDQTLRWFEMSERQMNPEPIVNPRKAVFTCLFWDPVDQLLYAADSKGFVSIINIYQEDKRIVKDLRERKVVKGEKSKQFAQTKEDVRINSIEIIDYPRKIGSSKDRRYLLVRTDFDIKIYKIQKEVKQQNMAGHVGPILRIISLEPRKIERILYGNQPHELIPDTPKIITASLDNTISLWDYGKMDTLSTMDAPKNSELTCITFLYRCFLVASGHEDGAIRLWNMEINSSVLLKCHDQSKKHTNTISCITSTFWKDSEFLICGSYDGKVSIWEISEKPSSGQENSGFSKITPQLRHVINNKKATAPEGHQDIEHQSVN